MGKLTCRCGNVISTNHDTLLAYRGDLLPEVHLERWSQDELQQLKNLLEVVKAGGSIADFAAPGSSAAVAEALLPWKVSGEAFHTYSRSVYQCTSCGRLLVETARPNEFRTFRPESDDTLGILDA